MLEQIARLRRSSAALDSSPLTFDGGGHYRIEIPSVETLAAFDIAVQEAARREVPIHRISQGSGIMLLTDEELAGYARLGVAHHIEVCLFVGPRAAWDGASPSRATAEGAAIGARNVGLASLHGALSDVYRAVDHGIRSVLVADEGLMALIAKAKTEGSLPADLIVKASALMGISNPYSAEVIHRIGADSINIPAETSLPELAAFRSVTDGVLDLYVEGPDSLGGFLRYHDIAEIIRIAAPVYVKFGLRNVAPMYPTGSHLHALAEQTTAERIRRAAIGLEHLARAGTDLKVDESCDRAGIPVA
ncbi:U32 family peptidase [Saccharopolyspora spinosa]|uniref:Peptidase U32-like protein n=1 Tax=Saccharopolyspora spinosa TaxID=60894 RepID=A0A2N3Y0R0_SACSN|nr:U32 family peptidase [Saccharopolyspora spinosa]PKW16490.1 peptidase U32-like protein [Saccharopolyspora spinosa]